MRIRILELFNRKIEYVSPFVDWRIFLITLVRGLSAGFGGLLGAKMAADQRYVIFFLVFLGTSYSFSSVAILFTKRIERRVLSELKSASGSGE